MAQLQASVRIEGLEHTMRELDNIGTRTKGRKLLAALEAGGRIVLAEAVRIVPVDTGALRASLHMESDPPTNGGWNVTVRVGTDITAPGGYPYSIGQEFGNARVAAQPYLRPALDEHTREIEDAIRNWLQRELRNL